MGTCALEREQRTVFAAERDAAIRQYVPLVKHVARRLAMSMPGVLDYEDILGHGTIGLIEALDRYDERKAVKFETYAMTRIRGAIIDALRALDRLPRSARQKARQLEQVRSSMIAELGREPTNQELAHTMGMTNAEYARAVADCGWATVSLDGLLERAHEGEAPSAVPEPAGPDSGDFSEGLERAEMTAALSAAIDALPERERLIVSLYYGEGLTRKEIGRVLDISESRVCQLHTRALARLREQLEPERAA